MGDECEPLDQPPFAGKKVVVTRPRTQAGNLIQILKMGGATIIEFPTIEIRPVLPPPEIPPVVDFDWVIFTSANAANALLDAIDRTKPAGDLRNCRVCAVGPGTCDALRRRGVWVSMVSADHIQEGVAAALKEEDPLLRGRRILLPKGNLARDYLAAELRQCGAKVTEVVVYRTVAADIAPEAVSALIEATPDVVIFTSASTAKNFAKALGAQGLERLKGTVFASMGPETTAAAQACGIQIKVEPTRHTLMALVFALAKYFGKSTAE